MYRTDSWKTGAWQVVAAALVGITAVLFVQTLDGAGPAQQHVMIPMRDGVGLSTDLYFPADTGPWPVLYEQRYVNMRGEGAQRHYAKLASTGYVVATQNFRGSILSDGEFQGYRALGWGELQDSYDSVEWLAKQPWSTGKIGSFGGSQGGIAQNFLAVAHPPHLVTQYMRDTGLSLFHEAYRMGGTTRWERFSDFINFCRNPVDGYRWLQSMAQHQAYDEWWEQEDCTRHFDRMNVPSFTVGGWYDYMIVGDVESYIGRQHQGGAQSRGQQHLLIGPWLHGANTKDQTKTGDLEFPPNAKFDMDVHMIRWFDHYLKGVDNGADREAPVTYYVLGAPGEEHAEGNTWRTASDWPVPSTATSYYLNGTALSLERPSKEGTSTTFLSDPIHPAPIPEIRFAGGQDARAYEKHPDVRTFTTEPLSKSVEWSGKVSAELFVSSTAKDGDFIVRITDVYPDGRSILIFDAVRRARFRDGFDREVLMKPGQVYRIAFDVGWVSQIFNRGHRIRATVASTGSPFYEPNPNTGDPITLEPARERVISKNTVWWTPKYPSRVIAPVR